MHFWVYQFGDVVICMYVLVDWNFVLDLECLFVLVELLVGLFFMGIVVLCTIAVFWWVFFLPWVWYYINMSY